MAKTKTAKPIISTSRVHAQFVRKGDIIISGVYGPCRVMDIYRDVFDPEWSLIAKIYIPGGFMDCRWYDDEWIALP